MKMSENLYAAADYIREHGWVRRSYRSGNRCCMLGAIAATGGILSDAFVGLPVGAHQALKIVCGGVPAAEFNDKYCKTANDAIAALEIAADIAAASGE